MRPGLTATRPTEPFHKSLVVYKPFKAAAVLSGMCAGMTQLRISATLPDSSTTTVFFHSRYNSGTVTVCNGLGLIASRRWTYDKKVSDGFDCLSLVELAALAVAAGLCLSWVLPYLEFVPTEPCNLLVCKSLSIYPHSIKTKQLVDAVHESEGVASDAKRLHLYTTIKKKADDHFYYCMDQETFPADEHIVVAGEARSSNVSMYQTMLAAFYVRRPSYV